MEAAEAPLKLIRFYGFRGLRLVRGRGQYVWDSEGRRYLDCHAGHGAAFLGHANPEIAEAVARQASELVAVSSGFTTPALEEALQWFSRVAPSWAREIVFLNTGTEAVEAALKAAWLYTGRRRIVAFRGSFHGRTLASLSATWNPKYRRGLPVLGDVEFLPFNADPSELSGRIPGDTAAIIVEPVQGEGGVEPATREFLRALREEADRVGALLIFDEVQVGFGRTGAWWSHQHYGVEPDIMTAGKSIAGGLPASAVVAREGILEKLSGGMHGSTHAGNPVSMAAVAAAARHALRVSLPGRAAEAGEMMLSALREALGGVRAVRRVKGLGLMIGVELRFDPGRVIRCMQEEEAVLALKAGATTVRLLPPYMVTGDDARWAAGAVRSCICRAHGC